MTSLYELTLKALKIRTALMEEKTDLALSRAIELQAVLEDLDDNDFVIKEGENDAK